VSVTSLLGLKFCGTAITFLLRVDGKGFGFWYELYR